MSETARGILQPLQERYLENLQGPRDPLLLEMEELAAAEDIPISHPQLARLLEVLVRATGARRVLEVGTAIGYAALRMALAAPEATVVAIDRDGASLARARGFLERAGVAERVRLMEADAAEALGALQGGFELVFLDADKDQYRRLLDLILTRMAVGGLLVIDNLLWKGEVADPPDAGEDPRATAVRAFNTYLMMHPQLNCVVLPLGDGVGLATKLQPLITDMGGPF